MTPSSQPRLLPSFLNRLLDPESMGGRLAGYDHRQMLAAVRVDLEDLLNAKLSVPDLPAEYTEVAASIVAFGLPDLTRVDLNDSRAAPGLARAIERAVARFEPRLRKVRVTAGPPAPGGLTITFKVDAELNVDPAPEVGFETVLELTSGRALVRDPGAGA